MSVNLLLIAALVLIILWLVGLTFALFRFLSPLGKINSNGEAGLKEIILSLSKLEDLKEHFAKLEKKNLSNFQKSAVVRYNPFGDTGGDQSFAVAILDAEGSGFVISSLHGRAGTRIYGKPVKKGKEAGYQFSDEERRAIKQALAS